MTFPITHRKQARPVGAAKEKISEAVFVNVTRCSAGKSAFEIQPHFGSDIAESTVSLIAVECRRRAIVRNEQIDVAVVVEVGRYYSDRVTSRSADFRDRGNVGELSIAVVSEQQVRGSGKIIRERRWPIRTTGAYF